MKEGYSKTSMPKSLKVFFGVSWVDLHVDLVQVHATFATSGSDGAYNFWDKDSRQRLKVFYLFLFQQDFWVLSLVEKSESIVWSLTWMLDLHFFWTTV
jgi:hypothetical protein